MGEGVISLLDDVQSKKPHLRLKGGVWSCTSFKTVQGLVVFRMGMGYCWRSAYADWQKQEFA